MSREEVISLLEDFNDRLEKMSDEELYLHMMESSSSFRRTVRDLDSYIESTIGT